METLPAELTLSILQMLASSGQTFGPLVVASKNVRAVYTTYAKELDKALVSAAVGRFLPLAWLAARGRSCKLHDHQHLKRERTNLEKFSTEEMREAFRTHSMIKASARNIHSFLETSRRKPWQCGVPEYQHLTSPAYFTSTTMHMIFYEVVLSDYFCECCIHADGSLASNWNQMRSLGRFLVPGLLTIGVPLNPILHILKTFFLEEVSNGLFTRFLEKIEHHERRHCTCEYRTAKPEEAFFQWCIGTFRYNFGDLYRFTSGYHGEMTDFQHSYILRCMDSLEARIDADLAADRRKKKNISCGR